MCVLVNTNDIDVVAVLFILSSLVCIRFIR